MKTNVFALALILIIAIAAHYGIIDEDFVLAMMQAVFCRKYSLSTASPQQAQRINVHFVDIVRPPLQ